MEEGAAESRDTESRWQYDSVPDGSIRLIDLQPGHENEPIHLELVTIRFEEAAHTYGALSYCWGKEAFTSTIYIGSVGHSFNISPTLYSALSRVRFQDQSRKIWVDAICINQSDDIEKNQQVKLMGQIFRKATVVLTWLGEEDEETLLGLRCLKLLNNLLDEYEDDYPADFPFPLDQSRISALNSLFQRPWFNRLWVVQEIALAQRTAMMIGQFSTLWALWVDAVLWLSTYGRDSGVQFHNFASLRAVVLSSRSNGVVTQDHVEIRDLPLFELLSKMRNRNATDPRDKVYGLLGMAHAMDGFEADYRKSTREVYIETARRLMIETGSLGVLDAAAGVSPYPSWVPDWSMQSTYVTHHWNNLDGSPRYNASLGSKYAADSDDLGSSRLELRGKRLDVISRLIHNSHHAMDGINAEPLDALSHSLQLGVDYTITQEPTVDALWRTLAWDALPSSRRVRTDRRHHSRFRLHNRVSNGAVTNTDEIQRQLDEEVRSWIRQATRGWSLFVSDHGYLGLAHKDARPGDIICLLLGGQMPFILRRKDGDVYELVSSCYLHGFMDGEGLLDLDLETFNFEKFTLV